MKQLKIPDKPHWIPTEIKIIEYLKNDKEFQEHINSIDGDEYEVIIGL